MKKISSCTLFLVCLLASLAVAQSPTDSGAVAAKTNATTSEELTTLVFYRPKRFVGSGLTPSVYLNGEQLARLDNGRYFVTRVAPGNMKIESSMKHDPLEIEAKPGKVQYFEMVILAGNWRGGGRIIPTGISDGQESTKKLKPLDKKWVTSEKVSFLLPEAKVGN